MTTTGENRARYAAEVEPRPSRFADPEAYRAWASRADAWALAQRAAEAATAERERAEAFTARYDAMTEPERIAYHEQINAAKLDRGPGILAPESVLCSGDMATRGGNRGRGWFRVILTAEGSRVVTA